MKRIPRTSSPVPAAHRVLDARRLTRARGGSDLDIAVRTPPPLEPVMQQQHNELLVHG